MIYIKAYPLALTLIAIAINIFLLGVNPHHISLPTKELIYTINISAILLIINHTWIMTVTELSRARHGLYATTEEWEASGKATDQTSKTGLKEVERHHNIHRNTTENTIYYILLSAIFMVITPNMQTAYIWILLFPLSRLGYTYSYIKGNTSFRGIFMSLGLLSIYGMATYLALSMLHEA